jgi:putative Ca2+/H+ antiporter (TMEM165/GDT1 family)
LVATIFNHTLAALFGTWVAQHIDPNWLRWLLGGSFLVFAVWVLVPDKDEEVSQQHRFGAFLTTLVMFFLAEMGDKTQLSTVALAARYNDIVAVTMGTTLGMMFSDGLAVVFGEKLTQKISMKWIRVFSALLFLTFGLMILLQRTLALG